ncbi:MAG: trigger factor [Saprospiraceae bacterium]|nr:trigger factor [Saprospiraceae bacterium]
MSNVVRTDIDALNATLAVTLTKDEYLAKVNKDIKRYTQRVQRPGFRPGKTPTSLVKKLYGDAFVIEAVQDMMQQKLSEYLQEQKPDIFGQPILAEKQAEINFDPKQPKDITFTFDIGLVPEFEVQGLDNVTYERYAVNVDESKVEAEIENLLRRNGEEKEIETNIEDGDMVTLHIKEQGGSLEKEDLLLSMNWVTDEMKEVFRTQKKGDTLTVNIFQLEKETTPQYVRKYFLGLEDTDEREINENFEVKIKVVKRQQFAEINQEFFDNNFGKGVVSNETEMRDLIRKSLGERYIAQADALLLRNLQDKLIEANQFDLPDTFLKRWLRTQNENNTAETVEKGYPSFAQNLRWTLVRSKIARSSNVSISDDDLKAYYANRIRGYLGGQIGGEQAEQLIESLTARVLEDEKQVSELYEDVMTEKTFEAMKSRIHIVEKPIDEAEFSSIMAAAQYEAAKARGELQEEASSEASEDLEVEEIEVEEV